METDKSEVDQSWFRINVFIFLCSILLTVVGCGKNDNDGTLYVEREEEIYRRGPRLRRWGRGGFLRETQASAQAEQHRGPWWRLRLKGHQDRLYLDRRQMGWRRRRRLGLRGRRQGMLPHRGRRHEAPGAWRGSCRGRRRSWLWQFHWLGHRRVFVLFFLVFVVLVDVADERRTAPTTTNRRIFRHGRVFEPLVAAQLQRQLSVQRGRSAAASSRHLQR